MGWPQGNFPGALMEIKATIASAGERRDVRWKITRSGGNPRQSNLFHFSRENGGSPTYLKVSTRSGLKTEQLQCLQDKVCLVFWNAVHVAIDVVIDGTSR